MWKPLKTPWCPSYMNNSNFFTTMKFVNINHFTQNAMFLPKICNLKYILT